MSLWRNEQGMTQPVLETIYQSGGGGGGGSGGGGGQMKHGGYFEKKKILSVYSKNWF